MRKIVQRIGFKLNIRQRALFKAPQALVKIRDFLNKPYNHFKMLSSECDRIESFMLSKQKYFKPGKYKIISLGKTIAYKDFTASVFIKNQAGEFNGSFTKLKLYLKLILGNLYCIQIPSTANDEIKKVKYKGDFALFTAADDIKIFDMDNRVVLNLFDNPGKYSHLRLTYSKFKQFINIPVIEFNDESKMVVEKYIPSSASRLWSKNKKKSSLEIYHRGFVKYLKKCLESKQFRRITSMEILGYLPNEYKSDIVFAVLNNYLKYNKNREWLHVNCHGDLWSRNILLDQHGFYIIDWENSGPYIFFYDFFHYLMTEKIWQSDSSLISTYFAGGFDHCLEQLFEVAGGQFDKKERFFYLGLCVLQKIYRHQYKPDDKAWFLWVNAACEIFHEYSL